MQSIALEIDWLKKVDACIEDNSPSEACSWSSYHASRPDCPESNPKSLSAILPLFPDASHSVSMIKHSMTIVKQAVDYINPGQTPVLACDQPLYAIAK